MVLKNFIIEPTSDKYFSGNCTSGDRTSGGPPVPVNDFFRLAKKQQNCSNPAAVVLTMVLSFTMHLKGTGHYGFV